VSHQLGVDVGGTFTDLVLCGPDGRVATLKELTTPAEPARGVLTGIDRLLEQERIAGAQISRFVHATTLVANAVLERRGARTALVATEGFRDILEIRRELRYDLFEQHLRFPEPLVPRALRFTLDERVDAAGRVLRAPSPEALTRLLDQVVACEPESVAVALMHAYANPAHERLVAEALASRFPSATVSLSSEVLPQIREYERTSATVLNAYVQPIVRRYLAALADGLKARGCAAPVLVMTSTGGVVSHEVALALPLMLIESGPAAGALLAAYDAARTGTGSLVAFDMGGTTAKSCIIEGGRPLISTDHEVARTARFRAHSGMPTGIPVFDMLEVGAGGGSIARVDATGLIRVGPESVGASPGPACYGLGGTLPTVTDANLVLGLLGDDVRIGARRLDAAAARRAVSEHIAAPCGLDVAEAAQAIHDVVTETMAQALRVRAVEHNVDVRRLDLVSFGGAAGLHAAEIARRLGIRRVICPARSGVFAAAGLLAASPAVDAAQSWIVPLAELDAREIQRRFGPIRDRAVAGLGLAGVADGRVEYTLDMSYVGQEFEVDVALPELPASDDEVAAIDRLFADRYARLRGRRLEGYAPRIVTWRVRAAGEQPSLGAEVLSPAVTAPAGPGARRVFLDGRHADVPTYAWGALTTVTGPAVVEHPETSVLVPAGCEAARDAWGRLALALDGGGERGD
jgi:N-methylhydantoinase A